MITYKLTKDFKTGEITGVSRSDGWGIPFDPNNTDYQTYLLWLEGKEYIDRKWVVTNPNGNTPLPADD
jgi:hypothetical protein